jgi:hypothetical protein
MLLTLLPALVLGFVVQQTPPATISAASLVKQLAGVWKAEETRTPRSTELDEKVFGPGAVDVRDVTVTIQPTGQATFTLSKAVVGRNGRRYAPSVIEATLTIADPVAVAKDRVTPTVTVVKAEERYLDGDHERWPIEGARASILMLDPAASSLEFRFDTKDGRDSFGTSLKRGGARTRPATR